MSLVPAMEEPFAALFKVDTWPRLRFEGLTHACVHPRRGVGAIVHRGWSFENQNQIHYSRGTGAWRATGSSHCWPLSAWKRLRDFIGRLTIGTSCDGISGAVASVIKFLKRLDYASWIPCRGRVTEVCYCLVLRMTLQR